MTMANGKVVPLPQQQGEQQKPKPRNVETCRHGVPLDRNCAECHLGPDHDGGDAPAAAACEAPPANLYGAAISTAETIRLLLEWADRNGLDVDGSRLERIDQHARALRMAFARTLLPAEQAGNVDVREQIVAATRETFIKHCAPRLEADPIDGFANAERSICQSWELALGNAPPLPEQSTE
jgi:hypothetical protein